VDTCFRIQTYLLPPGFKNPFVKEYPNTIATSCLNNIASSFLKKDDGTLALGIEGYFRRIADGMP